MESTLNMNVGGYLTRLEITGRRLPFRYIILELLTLSQLESVKWFRVKCR